MSDTPKADVRGLAKLARLELSEAEVAKLEGELPAILGFVDEIQKVSADMPKAVSPKHRNVMRDDANPHESGAYTETLLSAAPNRIGNQVAVKQVVSRNRASHK
jgi:aspartyl-tRNA(Asn)/glutamyl-tRNA(Gln) amidotransferase subunit C